VYSDSTKNLSSTNVDFTQLLGLGRGTANLPAPSLHFFYGDGAIMNQHELEAAVNDHMNGVGQAEDFQVTILKEGHMRSENGVMLMETCKRRWAIIHA
jgi:hypothetical protein